MTKMHCEIYTGVRRLWLKLICTISIKDNIVWYNSTKKNIYSRDKQLLEDEMSTILSLFDML